MKTSPRPPAEEVIPASAPAPIASQPTPFDVIRNETVLSKLPIHNLSKNERVNIQIVKQGPDGQVDLKWDVSYSDRYGQAGQLAYKLDTLVIDRAIDEAGKPLPERLKLGSLCEISEQLGCPEGGSNLRLLRRAFHQNAGSYIVARFKYKANDGTGKLLEAGFHRYSVIFTGEKFADGRKADAVYIVLNPIYREVLNNSPFRPLNFEYKKQLPPTAQRFYEIVSYKIFAALKHNQPIARLAYSEYCTFSAHPRYFDYEHFKKQMYKVHRPHLKSGYISKVHYEDAPDEQGQRDWIMCYEPGPKARDEYTTFTGKKPRVVDAAAVDAGSQRRPRQRRLNLPSASESASDPQSEQPTLIANSLLAELAKRGVGDIDGRKLLSALNPEQPVLDQLEYGDYLIAKHGRIDNPPGFYISLLQRNVPVPANYLTSRKAKAIEEENLAKRQAMQDQVEAALAAEAAEEAQLTAQFESLPESDRLALLAQVKAEKLKQTPTMAYWMATNPEAGEFLLSRARMKLKEGWIPPSTKPRSEKGVKRPPKSEG